MASQISTYSQLLQLTREDIAFKKQMLEKMEKSDKELCTELANLNQVMSNIGYQTNQRFPSTHTFSSYYRFLTKRIC